MYIQERLVRDRHSEDLEMARRHRAVRQISEVRRLEKRQERAERQLRSIWRRTARLRWLTS
jgi:hypothetical protein